MDVIIANKAAILGLLFALSEVLSLVPSIKANGVFQSAYNLLKKLAGK